MPLWSSSHICYYCLGATRKNDPVTYIKRMLSVSAKGLHTLYPEQRDVIAETMELGQTTALDLAEHRGTGVYLFYDGKFWQFPSLDEYLTIPLWWLHERDLLQDAENLIMPAVEASGMFSIELLHNITVEPTEEGVAVLEAEDYVGKAKRATTVDYTGVTVDHLLAGNVKVKYGDHVCHVRHGDIKFDDLTLEYQM